MRLYGYFRSSAAFRVRIALNLKGVDCESVPVHLRKGEQRAADYLGLNPQGMVPTLEDDGEVLTQSLAIIEYLDETQGEPPLLPGHPADRARVRAIAAAIACDIHPLDNLRVLQYLKHRLGQDDAAIGAWYNHWIAEGFAAVEAMLASVQGGHQAALMAPTEVLAEQHAQGIRSMLSGLTIDDDGNIYGSAERHGLYRRALHNNNAF